MRNIRSNRPCRNSTLLIRASGMSIPLRVSRPWRNITRRSVITKCVVHQFRNGQIVSQPTRTSQITPITAKMIRLALLSCAGLDSPSSRTEGRQCGGGQ